MSVAVLLASAILACLLLKAHAQVPSTATIRGRIFDPNGNTLPGAKITLHPTAKTPPTDDDDSVTSSDSAGAYSFSNLAAGRYSVHADANRGDLTAVTTVKLAAKEARTLDLTLSAAAPGTTNKTAAKPPDFFDEPQFTVAGVTQGNTYGGHGSDNVTRASEALVKATGTLGKESANQPIAANESANTEKLKREHDELQSLLRRDEGLHDETAKQRQAARHHQLAEVCEKLGDPLAAVHEYQRAAELDPSEPHLFDWASELLLHRAPEPATEVFVQGNRLYPKSVRMLAGLGIAWYARRSYERASQFLVAASDLAPTDPTPYIFMGKMESVETVPTKDSVERLRRFARLAPDNPLANYYYALGLWKQQQDANTLDNASLAKIETLLHAAVELDPKLGPAFLQLGALHARQGDDARALAEYQKAADVTPELEEAHYRLSLALRRVGKTAEAQKEMGIYNKLSKKSQEEVDRKHHELQQFVITMRD